MAKKKTNKFLKTYYDTQGKMGAKAFTTTLDIKHKILSSIEKIKVWTVIVTHIASVLCILMTMIWGIIATSGIWQLVIVLLTLNVSIVVVAVTKDMYDEIYQ